ncbi:MAG TPA: tetratricopeptide repeat protein [Candidatus Poseidoniales archaeon]|nr:tetratricopeptide repeat protein [Candidatus Poseidoniales archaeon]HIK79211.1 tetratricopeptide repeat protein [Candidatus Poseidoniales archaeon]
MQECRVCGLLFLDSVSCPGCGSRSNLVLDAKGEGIQSVLKRGGIPGLDRFEESMAEIISDADDSFAPVGEKVATSLPFGLGGVSARPESTLPFGIGSNPQMGFEYEPLEFEIVDETNGSHANVAANNEDEGAISEPSHEESSSTDPPAPSPSSPSPPVKVEATIVAPLSSEPAATSQPTKVVAVPLPQSSPDSHATSSAPVSATPEALNLSTPADEEISTPMHEDSDVVIHDFSQDSMFTEMVVNLDDLAEPVSASQVFNPEGSSDEGGDPQIFPSRAMLVNTEGNPQLSELVTQGFNAMNEANWQVATKSFQTIVKSMPQNPAAMNNYGVAMLQRAVATVNDQDPFGILSGVDSHFEGAIMALRQAAKIDSTETDVLFNLASALCSSGRYDKAVRIFDVYLDRSGEMADGYNGKAVALIGLGQHNEALIALRKAQSIEPDNSIINANLSRVSA